MKGNPKPRPGARETQTPPCHQIVTFHQPTVHTVGGILAIDRNTNCESRGGTILRSKTIAIAVALCVSALTLAGAGSAKPSKRQAASLTGAGSTFVSKLVQAWVPRVAQDLDMQLTYGAIGSGGGIAQITNRTVDFGASDAPLTPDQFAACKSCVQIPFALSATSVPYRLDGGPNRIRLNGKVLADIYLGKIKTWNDPAIRKLN